MRIEDWIDPVAAGDDGALSSGPSIGLLSGNSVCGCANEAGKQRKHTSLNTSVSNEVLCNAIFAGAIHKYVRWSAVGEHTQG